MVSVANEGQGQTELEWRTGTDCPLTVDQAAQTGTIVGNLDTATVEIREGGPTACVWVVARDRHGARALDTHQVAVADPQLELKGPAILVSGQQAEFTASYPAEPDLPAHFYWATAADCTAARNAVERIKGESRTARTGSDRFPHRVPRQAFCVVVLARDKYDVAMVAELAVPKPMNGDPFIRQIQMATAPDQTVPAAGAAVPLFADVQLAAGAEGDFLPGEPVTFTWRITTPAGTELPVSHCPGAQPVASKVCFQPAVSGTYRIELSILDAGVSRPAQPLEVKVEDFPPCITATTPPFQTASKVLGFEQLQRDFTVLEVQDDGDPLPPPARSSDRGFFWFVREPGSTSFEWRPSERYPSFIIPPRRYQALQRVEVRLEYRDRVSLANLNARSLAHCKPEDPECVVVLPTGRKCHQWVTWTVDYQ